MEVFFFLSQKYYFVSSRPTFSCVSRKTKKICPFFLIDMIAQTQKAVACWDLDKTLLKYKIK